MIKDIVQRFCSLIGKIFGWAGLAVGLATFLFMKHPDQFPAWVWFATILIAIYKQKAFEIFKLFAGRGRNE